MSSPLTGPAEAAVVRAAGTPVFCHDSVDPAFAEAAGLDRLDEAATVDAIRAAGGTAGVVVSASAVATVRTLLDAGDWECGRLWISGTGEEAARRELERLDWLAWVRVRYVDLEYVPPRVYEDGPGFARLVGGLGLVEVDQAAPPAPAPRRAGAVAMARLIPELQSALVPQRIAAQQIAEERRRSQQVAADLTGSVSWRITAPLRALKQRLRSASR